MMYAKSLLLALLCLCISFSHLVQDTSAQQIQLKSRAGRALFDQQAAEDVAGDDDNEGDEGNEGNEGTIEGDEGDGGMGDGMPDPMTPEEPEEVVAEEPVAVAEEPEEVAEEPEEVAEEPEEVAEEPEEPEEVAEEPEEEAEEPEMAEEPEEETEEPVEEVVAEAPVADSPSAAPVGTRDFVLESEECTTLRGGISAASPVLAAALPSIAPEGEDSVLSMALDDPTLNVTLLLPDEEILTSLGALLGSDDAAGVTPEIVQEILLDHVLAMSLDAADLLDLGSGMIDLITGDEIEVDVDAGAVMFTLNNITASVIEADLDGCAGDSIIHRIDAIFADLPSADDIEDAGIDAEGEEGAAGFLGFSAPLLVSLAAAVALFL